MSRPRRALLYMPGTDWRKIEKAAGLKVDSACMDLEDGVALNHKEEARATVLRALGELDFGCTERLVRINPVGSGLEAADLDAVAPAWPDGIVLPKVADAQQVLWTCNRLAAIERAQGWPQHSIYLLAIVESAAGVVNLAEIAGAHERLQALIFGAEDLAGDIGAKRTTEAWEVFYARSALVTHAAAFDLAALDMVSADFRDLEALEQEARQGAGMGFVGKQVIHPDQVAVVQAAFTPSPQDVAAAQELVAAFEAQQQAGVGAFALEGKMVDMPMVRAAQRVLARAAWED